MNAKRRSKLWVTRVSSNSPCCSRRRRVCGAASRRWGREVPLSSGTVTAPRPVGSEGAGSGRRGSLPGRPRCRPRGKRRQRPGSPPPSRLRSGPLRTRRPWSRRSKPGSRSSQSQHLNSRTNIHPQLSWRPSHLFFVLSKSKWPSCVTQCYGGKGKQKRLGMSQTMLPAPDETHSQTPLWKTTFLRKIASLHEVSEHQRLLQVW